ncbi:MAG: DUF4830 domain-containing protein [Ruminococcaceae bacterium]|nr:DUF4830 domain-containing protein [Oscillospiraceae bacterium]
MFVYSFKASTVRILGVVCVALVGLIALVAFVPTYVTAGGTDAPAGQVSAQGTSISYDKIKSEQDVVKFLSQFGWQVEGKAIEVKEVSVPAEFDKIYAGYNQIQLAQGLDLTRYKGKEVTRYTFRVTNYEGHEGTVYANVLVWRKKVIGGDICSAEITDGFVQGFEKK